ncbi:MAG: tRNA pseudouridine(55) synthase TruB [Deltaproteobacteria bacterium]|nr:tRNA pseudouridine(55) synthase TruB [Deltaproteobacteria bacterium]
MKKKSSRMPDGVLLVDKPAGLTSFDVVKIVKKMVHPMKIGHTGTLDPMATGLLPLTLGQATKLTRFLTDQTKRYLASLQLGTATDTLDVEGKVVAEFEVPDLTEDKIRAGLSAFEGEIQQIPPMYSALHHQGKRMYQLARQGLEVERKPRRVTIDRIELTDFGPDQIELDICCSAGTYIRSLAADLAEKLGTCGHLIGLRRIETDGWHVDQALQIEKLCKEDLAAAIIPIEKVLERYLKINVSQEIARRLEQGQLLGQDELNDMIPMQIQADTVVWFCSPDATVIVLANIISSPDQKISGMKFLRMLKISH